MKIGAHFSMWACVVFALACFGVAFNGLSEIDAVDAVARGDARGYAYFWLFLGAVATVCGVVWWWIVQREDANPSDERLRASLREPTCRCCPDSSCT